MEEPDFWDDADKANRQMKELKNLKDAIAEYDSLKQDYDDVATMIEMGNEEGDASLAEETQEMLDAFKEKFENMRIKTLLTGEYDSDGAILTLHAGAGGTEAMDWTSMLYRKDAGLPRW